MFKFKKRQKIFEIGEIKIGGQPGELPTVLIGSLFHQGHKIVRDRGQGIFDKEEAKRLIKTQEDMSVITGIPCMLDIVGETSEALTKYIDFVSGVTETPFLINGHDMSVRVKAAEYTKEIGLSDRVVYNSINYTLNEEEITAIRNIGVKTALVQAFNPRNPWADGMIQILEGNPGREGLLDGSKRADVKKTLIFMPVLDVPSVGQAARGIYLAKKKFGLPTGTAPIGVVGKWKKIGKLGSDAKKVCRAGAATLSQSMGADFIIYGSVAKARNLFPVCAMVNAMIAYNARKLGLKPLTESHPLYKIF